MSGRAPMAGARRSVLVVSPSEVGGGAEMIAYRLFDECRRRGLRMQMAVGVKRTGDGDVFELPNDAFRSPWARAWIGIASALGRPRLRNLGEPGRWLHRFRGREDMAFPASRRLLDLAPGPIGLVHAHNLHGAGTGFFDLGALPTLSRRLPVLLTLHDAWLLAGHCAHSFGCDRWRSGCGSCPDLTIPEALRRDGSAANFRFKQRIFAGFRLSLSTPSEWLMDRVRSSLLAPAVVDGRVIPNGVDLDCFRPGDRVAERRRLSLDERAAIVLVVGNTLRGNTWRDFDSAERAVRLAASRRPGRTVLLGLGDAFERHADGDFELVVLPRRDHPEEVAAMHRAADVYLHCSRADTFPTVVLEAMACGLPVVATAVGGIPEQVTDGETGLLAGVGDVPALAHHLGRLLEDPDLSSRLGAAAHHRATRLFGLRLMVDRYVDWYREITGPGEP